MKKLIVPACILMLSSLLACSTTKKVESPAIATDQSNKSVNNTIGIENDASWYTELDFNKGSSKLNSEDLSALNDLVKKSMDTGSITEIKVISWSDQEYPAKKQKTLSSKQKNLADHRNERIKEYLASVYPSLSVSVYNMAKRPNTFQDLFKTSDDRTKKSFERAGIWIDNDNRVNYAKKESTSLVLSILK